MANEVTQRDLQALATNCTRQFADLNRRFNSVAGLESMTKITAEHRKEIEMLRADVSRKLSQLESDVTALKTAVSRLQQAR